MNNLSNIVNESFDNGTGSIGPSGYVTFSGSTPITVSSSSDLHYDLRSFSDDGLTVRRTVGDLLYTNVGKWGGSGTSHYTVSQVQSFSTGLNRFGGYESWKLSTSGVGDVSLSKIPIVATQGSNRITASIGPNSTYRYKNGLSITLSGVNPSGTLTSTYTDDILTNFNDSGKTYLVSMVVRNAPSQSSALTLDLANSFIDITSDSSGAWSPSHTDSVSFSNFTTISSTSTRDSYIQFNRGFLTHSNLSTISGLRFRLKGLGSGSFTTEFQEMKVIVSGTSGYGFPGAASNTKYGRYEGRVGVSGTIGPLTTGDIFLYPARPKNLTQSVKFNTGTIPAVVSGTNQLKLYYRHVINSETLATSNVNLSMTSSGSLTQIKLYQTLSGTTYLLGNLSASLSGTTDYAIRTSLYEENVEASLYKINGAFYSDRVATTGILPLTFPAAPHRGHVGWNFSPYNFNFNINEITMQRAEFGNFVSDTFPRYKPVIAAQLNANTSPPIVLIESDGDTGGSNDFIASGDAVVTYSDSAGDPPGSYVVTRSGTTTWTGGIVSSASLHIGDPNELYLTGSIYPHSVTGSDVTYSGTYRVVLMNKNDRVGYIYNLGDTSNGRIIGNQWNNFIIPIRPDIISGKYRVIIENTGFYPSIFEIDNISLYHNTISWAAANDGSNYQPFFDKINDRWSALNFRTPSTSLRVKATALSDTNNWIESYVITPIFKS